ncbi:MAG: hypothetical protein GYA85_12170, partial [Propionibacterium sp.]|nr:hypothetical protein [Propionibacterium sp.]
DEVRDLVDLARSLEDLTRNAGKHAGGVVIAPTPLTDFSPLFAEHGVQLIALHDPRAAGDHHRVRLGAIGDLDPGGELHPP